MTAETPPMSDADLQGLSDLSLYNCLRFGPYKALIHEEQGQTREYSNMDIALGGGPTGDRLTGTGHPERRPRHRDDAQLSRGYHRLPGYFTGRGSNYPGDADPQGSRSTLYRGKFCR